MGNALQGVGKDFNAIYDYATGEVKEFYWIEAKRPHLPNANEPMGIPRNTLRPPNMSGMGAAMFHGGRGNKTNF